MKKIVFKSGKELEIDGIPKGREILANLYKKQRCEKHHRHVFRP